MSHFARNAVRFAAAQISAAAFAITLLAMIVLSRLLWPEDAALYRYDALLIACLAIQAGLLAFKLETWEEARAIAVYHVVGVVMEIFKVSAGSWSYPEPSLAQIGGVPLFTGFMYSAVGSYIARGWRLLRFELSGFPPFPAAALLAALIYVNFYTHHYVWDWRYALFAGTCLLFWRTRLRFDFGAARSQAHVVLCFIAVGALIWIAENIATWANVWLYPQQEGGWRPVSIQKISSWTLLMIVSFVLSAALHRPDAQAGPDARDRPDPEERSGANG